MAGKRPKKLKETVLHFSKYIKGHFVSFIGVTALSVLSAMSNVLGTYMLKPIINDYILPGDMDGLFSELVKMGVLYAIGILSTLICGQLMVHIGQQIVSEIRNDLFLHVQGLPMKFFDTKQHGEIMSHFTNDVDTIAEALNNSFTVMVQSFVTVLTTFIMLFVLDFNLSLIVLAAFIVMIIFIRYSGKKSHSYFSQQQRYLSELNGFVEEMIEGQKVVKVFNHEEKNMDLFHEKSETLRIAATNAQTFSGIVVPTIVSISYINYAIAACVGAFLAIAGKMSIASLTPYLVYVRQTAMPANMFSQQLNILLAALAGAEHIFELTDLDLEVDTGSVTLSYIHTNPDGSMEEDVTSSTLAWKCPQENGKDVFVPVKGDVRFHDVSFGYYQGQVVLNHMNLYAKPGQKIAFVGSTGAGKTTITNMINRFYEVDSGKITYDGIDIREIRKFDLRRSMAIVLQETSLFSGTIADNIRYGCLEASDAMVVNAAKLANADSFIRRLPNGYHTMLTGDGENLSQGQRQLLAIARAAITDPPVLVLDEATSSIDTYTEQLVEVGMDHLMVGRTVFVIAHRLSTVRNSNAIMVIENGEIMERGSHDELVSKRGQYYKLYTGQFELL